MYSKLNSCIIQGLNGELVEVETDLSNGMPQFNIVGLADVSIKESKERVRTAIKNSGFEFPLKRITINLAPADIKKEGSQLDLGIAVGILKSSKIIREPIPEKSVFLGELSLDGRINGVIGALPMVISMREKGIKTCIVPFDNREECSVIEDLDIIAVSNLRQVVAYLNGDVEIEAEKDYYKDHRRRETGLDFSDMKGQYALKRALEISAAGFHNLLMIGPPGSGKTMAAKRLPSILPHLDTEEAIEVTKIYSISGLLEENGLMRERPFRAPHHTASGVSLIGGGRVPKPGEISLSHNGVLFLDEMPEFSKSVLEVLRQPLEDGVVTISRAHSTLSYPSNFILIGSMNPCPCGYYKDPLNECTCSQRAIDNYLNKLSNPLLDRIDIHIDVLPVKYEDLSSEEKTESSEKIRARVEEARSLQLERFRDTDVKGNAYIRDKDLKKYCGLKNSSEEIMEKAFRKFNFSARTYNKLLKVARTIADLEGARDIEDRHILESIRYRVIDDKYW